MALAVATPCVGGDIGDVRFWEPARVEGVALRRLAGSRIDRLSVHRCSAAACEPIPFQVDERDGDGRWVLDRGHAPTADDPPGVLDTNDLLLFMAADAGGRAEAPGLAGARRVVEVELADPLGFPSRWAYLAVHDDPPPRAAAAYVSYDPRLDRISGRAVQLGFDGGLPRHLSLGVDPVNLLDRLKIRARASFFWGLIRVTRSEENLVPGEITWKAGPVRVIRRQRHAVRIGLRVRSPRFGSDTFFYSDFAELPVSISLRVPPRYIFTDIGVSTILDFRDLSGGWRVLAPGPGGAFEVRCDGGAETLHGRAGEWFALRGEKATLVQRLERSASLRSVRQRLFYRTTLGAEPPEGTVGQCPGIGFSLDDWERVDAGRHVLGATSYALPPDADIGVFLATADSPLQVRTRPVSRSALRRAAAPEQAPEAARLSPPPESAGSPPPARSAPPPTRSRGS